MQTQQLQHNQQWYATMMYPGASAASSGGTQNSTVAQVWAFPPGQQYGAARSGWVMGGMDTADAAVPVQVQSSATQDEEDDEDFPTQACAPLKPYQYQYIYNKQVSV